uniref:Gamma-tubulin complex component n=1 Tax=Henneguya salminicola TaxID=69463 RepID=A0A6G3MK30_HENSL
MMHFLQNFEYFIQNDVIDPNWNILMSQINKAESLEELISKHNDFLDRTLKDCMLTHSKLVESFSSIINQCYSFPNEVMKNIKSNNINKLTKTIEIFHDVIINSVSSFVFLLYGKNGDHFEHNMIFLVEKLDFNYFYSNLNVDMASLNPALDSGL